MILKPQLYYVLLSLYTFPVMSFGRGMLIVFFGLGLSSEPLAAIGV